MSHGAIQTQDPDHRTTTAKSDKRFKLKEHGRERASLRALDLSLEEPQPSKVFGDPWRGDKDGRQRFDAADSPELMRK